MTSASALPSPTRYAYAQREVKRPQWNGIIQEQLAAQDFEIKHSWNFSLAKYSENRTVNEFILQTVPSLSIQTSFH